MTTTSHEKFHTLAQVSEILREHYLPPASLQAWQACGVMSGTDRDLPPQIEKICDRLEEMGVRGFSNRLLPAHYVKDTEKLLACLHDERFIKDLKTTGHDVETSPSSIYGCAHIQCVRPAASKSFWKTACTCGHGSN